MRHEEAFIGLMTSVILTDITPCDFKQSVVARKGGKVTRLLLLQTARRMIDVQRSAQLGMREDAARPLASAPLAT
jgi:hypothetical protein